MTVRGVDATEAVMGVLEGVSQPLTPESIADLLLASGISVSEPEVRSILQAAVGDWVEHDDQDAWRLRPDTMDPDQRRVISEPSSARLLVVAGPGAGKTEVACARVVAARSAGLPARSILMISFTRAATSEVRDRLARMEGRSKGATRGIEIRTLDSLAWTLQRNLLEVDLLTGSYADNIERMIGLLAAPPTELAEYLASIRLVVLDEAQDIVGRRSDLALALIRALPSSAGITVFADPAQAIYGDWAIEEGPSLNDIAPLHERIERADAGEFRVERLTGSHRTSDPELNRLATELREFALIRDMTAKDGYDGMRSELVQHGGTSVRRTSELAQLARHDVSQFFLFRTHGEAVQVSSYLSSSGMSHRIRFYGLPQPVHPWIGRLLSPGSDRRLREAEFVRLWAERVAPSRFATLSDADAWQILLAVAGDSDQQYVDVLHLREIVSRRHPPDEIVRSWIGTGGPLLGTIHGSKGREADDVVLAVSAIQDDADHGEEARVLYVGATRAREGLRVAEVSARQYYLKSRRSWRFARGQGSAQLEFGLDGDVDPLSPVSTRLGTDAEAVARQELFARPASVDARASWISERPARPGDDWSRVIRLESNSMAIAMCSARLESDLWEVANRFGPGYRPPDSQRHLYVVDYTTVARDDDSPDLNQISPTFARTGFWVSPIIKGYSLVYARRRRS